MKSLSTRYFLTSSAILTACKESTDFDDRPSLLPSNITQALPESTGQSRSQGKNPTPYNSERWLVHWKVRTFICGIFVTVSMRLIRNRDRI